MLVAKFLSKITIAVKDQAAIQVRDVELKMQSNASKEFEKFLA